MPPNWRAPMEPWPDHHSQGTKQLLDGVLLPAGQTPQQDLEAALDLVFNHPNVGPFICRQLEDKTRNGGRDLAMLQQHVAKDDLVAYGWAPGKGRAPAPGTQALAGELVQAWIDTGAECP